MEQYVRINNQNNFKQLFFGKFFFLLKILCVCIVSLVIPVFQKLLQNPIFISQKMIIFSGGIFMVIYIFFVVVYSCFDLSRDTVSGLCLSQLIAILLSNVLVLIIYYILFHLKSSFFQVTIWVMLQVGISFVWTYCTVILYRNIFPPLRTIVLYENKEVLTSIAFIYKEKNNFDVKHVIDLNQYNFIEKISNKIDLVFICGVSNNRRNEVIKYCIENNINVFIKPEISDIIIAGTKNKYMGNKPVLICKRAIPSYTYLFLKRFMDILISLIGVACSIPVLIVIPLIIYFYDRGPVIYKQQRLTKDGKIFNVLKFRSMTVDAEKDGVARLSEENDERITPIGKFIRATRIDEIPQLFNVLRGEMSIVGPRPERPEIANEYAKSIPEFNLRLQVKAGLTGKAQVFGKYNTNPYDKLQMDIMYISNLSVFQDIILILQTIKVVLDKNSTEGIEKGQQTAKMTQ